MDSPYGPAPMIITSECDISSVLFHIKLCFDPRETRNKASVPFLLLAIFKTICVHAKPIRTTIESKQQPLAVGLLGVYVEGPAGISHASCAPPCALSLIYRMLGSIFNTPAS